MREAGLKYLYRAVQILRCVLQIGLHQAIISVFRLLLHLSMRRRDTAITTD